MMYFLDWKPETASAGDLVHPPRLLPPVSELLEGQNRTMRSGFWRERWSLVYITQSCDTVCQHDLYNMRQLHVSLYKDAMRLQRVLITSQTDINALQTRYPELHIIHGPAQRVTELAMLFSWQNDNPLQVNSIYLVDPLGHLVMRFSDKLAFRDIRRDLVRLLRYAWSG
ncbi:MAG: hypothetical protein ORN21_03725 [Methylophilaceae bacterium]|nr:hypothetical protein [Methylophilaceae bacterium]